MMFFLLKTHGARENYLNFSKMVSNLILKNHQLSPYKKEDGLESVSICEDLLALATAVSNVAKANAALLHDETLRRSLLHVAEAAVDSARNLLLAAQHKSSSATSTQAVDDFLSACHSTQQACLKLVLTIERAEEQKMVRSAEWCMDKIVLLEPIQNLKDFEVAFQNYLEAHEVFVNLVKHRVESMIDNSLKVQMYQSLEAVEQSTPMLKTAVIGSIKASPDNKQAHTGKEFAVNRSLQAMGDLLENLEKSPNINQVQQQESHFYTVIHQMLDVLQPDKRFDYIGNIAIDTESALRHVMFLAQSIPNDVTKSKLVEIAKLLLERVKTLDQKHFNATNSPDRAEGQHFSMACEEIIGILNDLEDMVKRLTIETTFDAFINLGNPSKALQELAVTLSKSSSVDEEQCREEMDSHLTEFQSVNKDISHVTSLTLAVFPYSENSRALSHLTVELEQCGLEFESKAISVATIPAFDMTSDSGQNSLSLCRRNWEILAVKVKDGVYKLISFSGVVDEASRVCQRDATALRTVATKRQVSEITDKQIEVLLRRLNGICSVTGQIVDNASDLIYRNGLLGLTNQVAKAATSLDESYKRCKNVRLTRSLPPSALKDACSDLYDKLQLVEECVKRLHLGLTRSKQPGLLNPIRLNARSKTAVQEELTPYANYLHEIKKPLQSTTLPGETSTSSLSDPMLLSFKRARENENLIEQAIRSLKLRNEDQFREKTDKFTEHLQSQLQLAAEYLSLAPETSKSKALGQDYEMCVKELDRLKDLMSRMKVSDPTDAAQAETIIRSLFKQSGPILESIASDVLGPWKAPPARIQSGYLAQDLNTATFEAEELSHRVETVRHLMNDLLKDQSTPMQNASLFKSDSASTPDTALRRSFQLLQTATHSLINAKAEATTSQGDVWALRMQCCLENIDQLLSPTLADLNSVSNAIGQRDRVYLNKKSPILQRIAETQLKLANLTGLSIRNSDEQIKFSQETEDFERRSSELVQHLADLSPPSTKEPLDRIESQNRDRKTEAALIWLRQWAFDMNKMEFLIDKHCGQVAGSIDRLLGAAHTLRQSFAPSDGRLQAEFQNSADKLQSDVISIRANVNECLRNCPDPEVRAKANHCLNNLSTITPNIVTKAKQLCETTTDQTHLTQLKREWAVSALYLSHLLNNSPGIPKDKAAHISETLGIPTEVSNRWYNRPMLDEAPVDRNPQTWLAAEKPSETTMQNKLEVPTGQDRVNNDETDVGESAIGARRGRKRPRMLSRNNTMTILNAAQTLKEEVENFWDPKDNDNAMLSAARRLAQQMNDLAEFTQGNPPLQTKEDFVNTAKAIGANGHSIRKWAVLIADRCVDQAGLARTLRNSCESIEMLGTQLSVVASVKAVCPEKHETDDALVTNAKNLVQAVSSTLWAAEACCIKGLNPKTGDEVQGSDGFETIRLATNWKRRLNQQRRQAANNPSSLDNFGLRRTANADVTEPRMRDYVKP